MRRRASSGQGIMEYILILSVVLLAILGGGTLIRRALSDPEASGLFPKAGELLEGAGTEWQTRMPPGGYTVPADQTTTP